MVNLIVTARPSLTNSVIKDLSDSKVIDEVRFNTASITPWDTPKEVIERLKMIEKPTWLDIKGRQLRISNWSYPYYGRILLNHRISVDLPAKIIFRGGEEESDIIKVKGNEIFLNQYPQNALGEGQAVNIIGRNLKIEGYLINSDKKYLDACNEVGFDNIMLSFFERHDDLGEILEIAPNIKNFVLKIESQAGMDFVKQYHSVSLRLMAARDDLWVNSSNPVECMCNLETIIQKDPNAIVASRLFKSVMSGPPSLNDYSDFFYMYRLGYRNFMICDTLSDKRLKEIENIFKELKGI